MLHKRYTATHHTGYQEYIEDIVAHIDRIGIRRFINEYGTYFHDKSPVSKHAGCTIYVYWVLEDERGQIVNPDTITSEYLALKPDAHPHRKFYRNDNSTSRARKANRAWFAGFKASARLHRLLKQDSQGLLRYGARGLIDDLWVRDERYTRQVQRSWKSYRKHQYKEA